MNPLAVKLLAALAVIVISFGAGWRVNGAFVAERDLAIAEAKTEMLNTYRDAEAGKAKILEDKLSGLRANERVIEREKLKIIDRDVYHNECIDSSGVSLVNQARAGKADSAKPADQVSAAQ